MHLRNALCIASALVSGAAHATDAVVTIETIEAVPGSTARVGVTIEVDDLIGALDFDAFAGGWVFTDIDYDGPLFANGWDGWDTTSSSTPNVSAACIFPEDQVTGFQTLFTMIIDVPSDAEIGSSVTVDFTQALVTNYQFTQFDVTVVPGGIDVIDDTTPCVGDLTGPKPGNPDGLVDSLDLLVLIGQWGSPCSGSCEADLTGPSALVPDGSVDALDFLMLLSQWGSSNCPQP